MAMATTVIAPGHWLRADAAASYHRMRAAGMPSGGITDAGRTRAEQEVVYARYLRGELKATAARPGTSKHETGTALDLGGLARSWVREHGSDFGWIKDRVRNEPWHMEYVPALDLRKNEIAPPALREDDDMPTMNEFLNYPAFDGGPTISEMFVEIHNIYRGLYFGGPSVSDPTPGSIVERVNQAPRDALWSTTVARGDEQIPVIQEIADTKTLVMRLFDVLRNGK